ncbi:VCBS domain-containing protein, partial [Shewanella colwelliana]|uniref:VCBS domain-containing protein n=1 Tax=Shewanella colwelliana TaxID=23 RepID=UPI0022B0556E
TIEGTATGAVQEDIAVVNGDLVATGTGTFDDIDLTDVHTLSAALTPTTSVVWNGGTLSAAQMAAFVAGFDAQIDDQAADTWSWDYTIDNSLVQFLAAGETITMSFTVTIDDDNNGTATQVVVVTITGTNDIPTIEGTATGAVQEDIAVVNGDLVATGTGTFDDIDLTDVHTLSAALTPTTSVVWNGGTLSAAQMAAFVAGFDAQIDDQAADTWSWDYTIDNSLVQFLAAGETITMSFTVTIDDDN